MDATPGSFRLRKMVQGGKYPPLLQIGIQHLPSADGRWKLCCHAHDSDARDSCKLFFGRGLFYMSYCGAIFWVKPILLELVVLRPFVLDASAITILPTK